MYSLTQLQYSTVHNGGSAVQDLAAVLSAIKERVERHQVQRRNRSNFESRKFRASGF